MGQLDERLCDVDLVLSEKLEEEEQRWESMVDYFQNSLQWLKMFHKKVGILAKDQIKSQML